MSEAGEHQRVNLAHSVLLSSNARQLQKEQAFDIPQFRRTFCSVLENDVLDYRHYSAAGKHVHPKWRCM